MSTGMSSGMSRRGFLVSTAVAAGAAGVSGWAAWKYVSTSGLGNELLPGEPLGLSADGKLLDTDYADPFAGHEYLGYLSFLEEGDKKKDVKPGARSGHGHNARRIIDLASLLTPEGRKTPSDRFFIRTEYPDMLREPAGWTIKIHGEVKKPQSLPLKELRSGIESKGPVLLECSGNARELHFGLMSVGDWAGIPLSKVIERAQPTAKAKAILINGFDDDSRLPYQDPPYKTHSWPTCSWIFTFDQLASSGAFLATELNGAPLPKDQGGPVRLIVPGWYGCTEVKWVNEIKFVDENEPATLQMQEFATRTLQPTHLNETATGTVGPELARDYRPATIDQAALPVRVEAWRVDGRLTCRVIGITWGGPQRTNKLMIRFLHGRFVKYDPVDFCRTSTSIPQYGIWCHRWEPRQRGDYWIEMRLGERGYRSRKMSQMLSINQQRQVTYHARLVHVPAV